MLRFYDALIFDDASSRATERVPTTYANFLFGYIYIYRTNKHIGHNVHKQMRKDNERFGDRLEKLQFISIGDSSLS